MSESTGMGGCSKIGRTHTHLQDATPLTVGQEWSGYATHLDDALARVRQSLHSLYRLAIGGTAVGTGINSPITLARKLRPRSKLTGHPFITAPNKFASQGVPRRNGNGNGERGIACIGSRINENCQ